MRNYTFNVIGNLIKTMFKLDQIDLVVVVLCAVRIMCGWPAVDTFENISLAMPSEVLSCSNNIC